jgi:hypothetical protein
LSAVTSKAHCGQTYIEVIHLMAIALICHDGGCIRMRFNKSIRLGFGVVDNGQRMKAPILRDDFWERGPPGRMQKRTERKR